MCSGQRTCSRRNLTSIVNVIKVRDCNMLLEGIFFFRYIDEMHIEINVMDKMVYA